LVHCGVRFCAACTVRGRQFPPCPRRAPAAGVGAGEGVRVAAAGVTAGVACSDDFAATNHAAGVARGGASAATPAAAPAAARRAPRRIMLSPILTNKSKWQCGLDGWAGGNGRSGGVPGGGRSSFSRESEGGYGGRLRSQEAPEKWARRRSGTTRLYMRPVRRTTPYSRTGPQTVNGKVVHF
jgi:hypothetical protein